jgi:hypothetical protein
MDALSAHIASAFKKDIELVFSLKVNGFLEKLADHYGMPRNELDKMWAETNPAKKSKSPPPTARPMCSHKITKGAHAGENCPRPCKAGFDKCSSHVTRIAVKDTPKAAEKDIPKEGEKKSDENMKDEKDVKVDEKKPRTCDYVYKRGKHMNEMCGKNCKAGFDKCSSHLKDATPVKAEEPERKSSAHKVLREQSEEEDEEIIEDEENEEEEE